MYELTIVIGCSDAHLTQGIFDKDHVIILNYYAVGVDWLDESG